MTFVLFIIVILASHLSGVLVGEIQSYHRHENQRAAELAKRMDAILNADKPQVDVFKVIELVKRDQTTTEEISEVDDFETYIDEQKDPSEMTPAELRKYKFEQWRRRIGS